MDLDTTACVAHLFKIRNGRVTRVVAYWDRACALAESLVARKGSSPAFSWMSWFRHRPDGDLWPCVAGRGDYA